MSLENDKAASQRERMRSIVGWRTCCDCGRRVPISRESAYQAKYRPEARPLLRCKHCAGVWALNGAHRRGPRLFLRPLRYEVIGGIGTNGEGGVIFAFIEAGKEIRVFRVFEELTAAQVEEVKAHGVKVVIEKLG